MIDRIKSFRQFINESKKDEKYPPIRIITTKDSYNNILKMGYFYSRPELIKHIDKLSKDLIKNKGLSNKNDKWYKNRTKNDIKKFNTTNLIFATPDWFNDGGHETGHGSNIIYIKPKIFDDFKITLTEVDSLGGDDMKIFNKEDIIKIYSFIKNIDKESDDKLYHVAKRILKKLNHKNENGFYDGYAEIQIHTDKIPVKYIDKILYTKNYYK